MGTLAARGPVAPPRVAEGGGHFWAPVSRPAAAREPKGDEPGRTCDGPRGACPRQFRQPLHGPAAAAPVCFALGRPPGRPPAAAAARDGLAQATRQTRRRAEAQSRGPARLALFPPAATRARVAAVPCPPPCCSLALLLALVRPPAARVIPRLCKSPARPCRPRAERLSLSRPPHASRRTRTGRPLRRWQICPRVVLQQATSPGPGAARAPPSALASSCAPAGRAVRLGRRDAPTAPPSLRLPSRPPPPGPQQQRPASGRGVLAGAPPKASSSLLPGRTCPRPHACVGRRRARQLASRRAGKQTGSGRRQTQTADSRVRHVLNYTKLKTFAAPTPARHAARPSPLGATPLSATPPPPPAAPPEPGAWPPPPHR